MINFIFLLIAIIVSYIISNRYHNSLHDYWKRIGVKYRFSFGTTLLLDTLSWTLLFEFCFYNEQIIKAFNMGFDIFALILFVLAMILFQLKKKILFVYPSTKGKLSNKSYFYYLFEKPASYMRLIISLPPVNKYGKQNVNKLVAYNNKMKDVPPIIIQCIYMCIVYLATVLSFLLTNVINIELSIVTSLLLFIVISVFLVLLGSPLFWIISRIKKHLRINITERVEFVLFIFLFICSLNVGVYFLL